MNKLIAFLFCTTILISCITDKRTAVALSVEKLKPKKENKEVIVVIPNEGCTGCISTAEAFLKNNIDKKNNVSYILTRINSKKILKIKLGEFYNTEKLILDTNNIIVYPDSKFENYPMILYYNNYKISSIDYQKPGSYGFENLLKYE